MNTPADRDALHTSALAEFSERVTRAMPPKFDLLGEAEARPTLLDSLNEMERHGYTVSIPYRATPTSRLGFDEWRLTITRPDRIQFELAYFLRAEPTKPHRHH